MQYDGTMDSSLFEFWFANQLLPTLEKGCVVVMDNASFHCKTRLFSVAQKAGITLIFLPPYSRNSTPLSVFGLGSNDSFEKFFPLVLLSTMRCLILFNFSDYTFLWNIFILRWFGVVTAASERFNDFCDSLLTEAVQRCTLYTRCLCAVVCIDIFERKIVKFWVV